MKLTIQFISLVLLFVIFSAVSFAQEINPNSVKKNTAPVVNSLGYITKLKPISYEYKVGEFKQLNLPAGKHFGFIGYDARLVVPSVVSNHHYWYMAGKGDQRAITTPEVDLEKLVPLLVGAIQEQQVQIQELKREVEQFKTSK
jgi:hypothetical protein